MEMLFDLFQGILGLFIALILWAIPIIILVYVLSLFGRLTRAVEAIAEQTYHLNQQVARMASKLDPPQ